jgi:hypothetical protein
MTGYRRFRRRYRTDHLAPAPPPRAAGDGSGVVYLALGDEHVQLAATSIGFLRRSGYRGAVRVITDADRDAWPAETLATGVELVHVDATCPARFYKTQIHRYGFAETLFLDTDILPITPIDSVWGDLAFADVAMALELTRVQHFLDYYWERDPTVQPELLDMQQRGLAEHPFYNSGVILFRRTAAVDHLFDTWHEEWRRFGGQDQCALVRAIARTGIRLHTLPACWNAPPTGFASLAEARRVGIRMLHFFSGEPRARLPGLIRDDG